MRKYKVGTVLLGILYINPSDIKYQNEFEFDFSC